MQFTSTTIVTLLITLSAASPLATRQLGGLCSSALDTAQCCDVSVDGIANLNCASPSETPATIEEFQEICAAGGQQASCCVLPLAGDGLLCTAP